MVSGVKGVGHAWARHRGTSPSVLLNAYYHKKNEYIWLRVGIGTFSEILSLL